VVYFHCGDECFVVCALLKSLALVRQSCGSCVIRLFSCICIYVIMDREILDNLVTAVSNGRTDIVRTLLSMYETGTK
ncbi:hypothetical protein X975_17693, partial [Stegodyphus mimosarum]